jgi:hypothetical protein
MEKINVIGSSGAAAVILQRYGCGNSTANTLDWYPENFTENTL